MICWMLIVRREEHTKLVIIGCRRLQSSTLQSKDSKNALVCSHGGPNLGGLTARLVKFWVRKSSHTKSLVVFAATPLVYTHEPGANRQIKNTITAGVELRSRVAIQPLAVPCFRPEAILVAPSRDRVKGDRR